jgi:hypothetical protein
VVRNTVWTLVVVSLLLLTFFLGLPSFHYSVALMISLIVRYRDIPLDKPLFAPAPVKSS